MEQTPPPENREGPPIPNTLDLILIDGKFGQIILGHPSMGVAIKYIDDGSSIWLTLEEWKGYEYSKPANIVRTARALVENSLMTEGQLKKVHWGPEQEEDPRLRGRVSFFGTYEKK